MSKLAILTTRHNQYPGIDTYSYYEFMALSDERLREMNVLYVADRQSTKHMRKLKRRAASHDIWIKRLHNTIKFKPVSITAPVHMLRSGIYVNIKENVNPEEIRKALLGHVREMTKRLLQNTGYGAIKLPAPGADDPKRRPIFGTKLKATRPPIGRLFNSKFELADYVVGMMPKSTEVRRRNALKYHICCKLDETALVELALYPCQQNQLVIDFC